MTDQETFLWKRVEKLEEILRSVSKLVGKDFISPEKVPEQVADFVVTEGL